jgi:hypothetical protein
LYQKRKIPTFLDSPKLSSTTVIWERVMNNDTILQQTGMALYQINETTLTNSYLTFWKFTK